MHVDVTIDPIPFLVIYLVSAIVCAAVAPSKGRSAGLWFLLSLVFWLVALLVLSTVPPLKMRPKTNRSDDRLERRPEFDAGMMVRCPNCRARVRSGIVCPACGNPMAGPRMPVAEVTDTVIPWDD